MVLAEATAIQQGNTSGKRVSGYSSGTSCKLSPLQINGERNDKIRGFAKDSFVQKWLYPQCWMLLIGSATPSELWVDGFAKISN